MMKRSDFIKTLVAATLTGFVTIRTPELEEELPRSTTFAGQLYDVCPRQFLYRYEPRPLGRV